MKGGTAPSGRGRIEAAEHASKDGGRTWTEPSAEIRLFPHWTELYGASNPHPLSDGRLLWAMMGTEGRFALQVHGGQDVEVYFKDIEILE